MDEHMKITYSSSISEMREANSSFDYGVLKVAYHGDNRNGSRISKETFENCIDSIYNCPIVCNYNRETDEIGSHDIDIVMKDGVPKMINITQPVGVVPESARYWWETYEDITGSHEYLCVEVLIWKRQEAYKKIKDNGITDESMEIHVKSGHTDEDVYVIDSFEFLAFCLLGTAEPCYESASLEVFSIDDFRKKYADMMEEFKREFKKVNTSTGADIHPQNYLEGGIEQLDQKKELLAKFGLSIDQLDFDIENMSLEDLEAKLQGKPNGDSGETPDNFSLSGEQFREELIDALRVEKVSTEWGEMSRYAYCDYDAETNEVFCYDVNDWNLYGFTYSMNGDHVVIDFGCKKRKKFSIVDFDEGDAEFSCEHMFKEIADASASNKAAELTSQFNADKAKLEEKYNTASCTISQMNSELEELRSYKQQKLSDERVADENVVFAMFTDLNGIEAFEKLRTNCSKLSIEELEDKCYAIRGRNSTQTFSAQRHPQKTPRLPIENSKPADEPYGGLFVEFPPTR